MKQYIVDAFTDKPFSGNPAAVCIMDSWPSEESMMKLAMENNLSETAFIVKEEAGYHLRWFTPGTEVELCGHATLASSYVILTCCEPESSEVHFHTLSGVLTVRKKGDLYEMDFPTYPLTEISVTDAMEQDDFYHLMNGKFCGEAWDAISRYVYTALQGGSIMKGWTNDDRMMIACCNDGTRPVIFKIERIDIPETDEEREWLAKRDFRNTAENVYTG